MPDHTYEVDAKCTACEGTGLYVGMAERDGAAVVCFSCKGQGHRTLRLEWDDFSGLMELEGVDRVFSVNVGICIGGDNLEDFGGVPKQDWFPRFTFPPGTEDRRHTCPSWFYQSADYRLKPDWDECYSSLGKTFSGCQHFHSKANCWERWDKDRANA